MASFKAFQEHLATAIHKAASWCRRPPQRGWLCFILAFSPAIITAWLIAGDVVDVPVWDDWERGVLIEKARSGTLDLAYLTSAHIDHRPFFPRILTLAANAISGGDLRLEMWLGFLAVLVGALGLLFVLRQTIPSRGWFWATAFAVNLLVFSPLQYQNFLWATQLAFLLPLGCLGLLLAVMASGWRPVPKIAAAATLAFVASFSFGHGLILWPVAVCLALMDTRIEPARTRWILAGALAAVAAITVYGYFNWNYINTSQPAHAYGASPGEPPPAVSRMANLRDEFERVKDYFWSSLGNPIARLMHSDPARVSIDAGRWLMFLFAVAVVWMLVHRKGGGHWKALLPWAALGMFAITAAALAASGRGAHMPFERSLLSRYLSVSGYLPIAIVGMAAYILHHYRHRDAEPGRGTWASGTALALLGAFAGLQSQAYVYGAHKMTAWKSARLQERFQLLYAKHKAPRFPASIDGAISGLPPGEKAFAIKQALYLHGEGLLNPPLFEELDFGSFGRSGSRARVKQADLLAAHLLADDRLHLAGFATLEDGRIGDGMLVAWRPAGDESPVPVIERNSSKERAHARRVAGQDWELLDIMGIRAAPAMLASFRDGQFGANRMDAAKLENSARFDDLVDISQLPSGELVEIVLWVADTEEMKVSPLKRSFRFTKGVTPPGELPIRPE